ncbi:MAG TPA: hypothetical protein VGL38_01555 [bacterium]|jgi:hypothetical protein
MAHERNTGVLILIGVLWLGIAVVWGIQVYGITQGRMPVILTYGMSALIAGLFLGRAMQKFRTLKPPKI